MKKKIKEGNIRGRDEIAINVIVHAVILAMCVFIVYTFCIVIGSSFQGQHEIQTIGYRALPKKISFEAYKMIFNKPETIINSYVITIVTTVVGTIIGLIATAGYGYVISRKDFRYRRFFSVIMIFSMLFNGGLVATYIAMTSWLNLQDNFWVLILPVALNPWNVLVMKSFFAELPGAVIESARLDGAGELRTFWQIVLPMSKPVVAAIALFLTLTFWNDYQQSLMYIETESMYKLQYMLMKILMDLDFLNSAQAADMGVNLEAVEMPTLSARMAMCVIAAGPILCVFPFFQKYFVKGISLGSVKE